MDMDLERNTICFMTVGHCSLSNDRTQASRWQVGPHDALGMPDSRSASAKTLGQSSHQREQRMAIWWGQSEAGQISPVDYGWMTKVQGG